VPALLKHLGIETVSFACHSGGTLFAMDMLLHHPELLDPRFPYIALAGPWIHTSHTGVVSLSMAKALPSGLVAQFDKVVGFVHNHLESWTSTSFGISEPIANLFATPPSGGIEDESVTFEENTMAKALDRAHKENIEGVSSEALVLLRNIKGMDGWGDWGDYDELIRRVGNAFREAGRKLTIDVFYAETDSMIGLETAKGAQWFDNCWRAGGDTLEYSRRVVKGTDHNSLWQLRWGVPQLVFAKLGGRNGSEQPTAS
jgi:pimeloyl-ACP methyl ester carboxylesterase